jgi:putative tricarboxylic transport membrane protein
MGRPVRKGDFAAGLVLAALGAFIVAEARGWTYMGEDGPGPGFFPMWYGSLMVVLSLALVARSVIGAAPGQGAPKLAWRELARALTCWAAFVACITLMNLVGFAPAFALLTWFIVAFMARRPQRVALPLALGGAALFHVVFVLLLDVNLPRGIFF